MNENDINGYDRMHDMLRANVLNRHIPRRRIKRQQQKQCAAIIRSTALSMDNVVHDKQKNAT